MLSAVLNAAFKTVADESRRNLPDELNKGNGQNVGALSRHHDILRQPCHPRRIQGYSRLFNLIQRYPETFSEDFRSPSFPLSALPPIPVLKPVFQGDSTLFNLKQP